MEAKYCQMYLLGEFDPNNEHNTMFTSLDMTHSSFLLQVVAFITVGMKSIPVSCTYTHLTLTINMTLSNYFIKRCPIGLVKVKNLAIHINPFRRNRYCSVSIE